MAGMDSLRRSPGEAPRYHARLKPAAPLQHGGVATRKAVATEHMRAPEAALNTGHTAVQDEPSGGARRASSDMGWKRGILSISRCARGGHPLRGDGTPCAGVHRRLGRRAVPRRSGGGNLLPPGAGPNRSGVGRDFPGTKALPRASGCTESIRQFHFPREALIPKVHGQFERHEARSSVVGHPFQEPSGVVRRFAELSPELASGGEPPEADEDRRDGAEHGYFVTGKT